MIKFAQINKRLCKKSQIQTVQLNVTTSSLYTAGNKNVSHVQAMDRK